MVLMKDESVQKFDTCLMDLPVTVYYYFENYSLNKNLYEEFLSNRERFLEFFNTVFLIIGALLFSCLFFKSVYFFFKFKCEKKIYPLEKSFCAICQEDILTTEVVFSHRACKNVFHKTCTDSLVRFSNSCPVCRGELQV
jgi:hypothetical protein